MAVKRSKQRVPANPLNRVAGALTAQQYGAITQLVKAVNHIGRGVGATDYRRPTARGVLDVHGTNKAPHFALAAFVQRRCEPELWAVAEALLFQRPLDRPGKAGRPPGSKDLGRKIRNVKHDGIAAGLGDGAMWAASVRLAHLVNAFKAQEMPASREEVRKVATGSSSLDAIMASARNGSSAAALN